MAISSFRLSFLSLHPDSSQLSLSSPSVSSHRHRSRRKNHLRPKIPNSPLPSSPSSPPQPLEHFESSSYSDGNALLILEEAEETKETFASFEGSDVFTPGAEHRWFPWSVLDLAARFAILLAVQTAVAFWFLAREDGGRSNEVGIKENKKVIKAEKGTVVEDFEKMVAEIREMASDARVREAEERVNGGGGEDDEGDHRGVGMRRMTQSIARIFMEGQGDALVQKEKSREPRLRNVGVGYFPKGNGFGGSKPVRSGSGPHKGGTHQITYSSPAKESRKLPVPTKSNAQTSNLKPKSFENEKIKRVPKTKKLSCVNNGRISPKIKIDESKYAFESNDSSPIEDSQKNQNSSMVLTSSSDRDRESISGSHESQWWIKLQYVFGILLHKGSENKDRGLYSLPIAHDGKKHSYTITFQDRGDALNFSFLLESFFEDLGNVSADIVPLTIHELGDAISPGELKLIVVRKGQLRLYAGQPLVEVENTLRSLLE
ncbi:hypothetical protein KSP39_PZI003496 [Platanthera zijinensis]|uniref:Uncharacterized protein n=1 Tax=Platanthera zijinensis TaxID=2320716 RepID=A0AAP0BWI6_9ASPA